MTKDQLRASIDFIADESELINLINGYIDISIRVDNGRMMEVGETDGETVQLYVSHAELIALHAVLTRILMDGAEE